MGEFYVVSEKHRMDKEGIMVNIARAGGMTFKFEVFKLVVKYSWSNLWEGHILKCRDIFICYSAPRALLGIKFPYQFPFIFVVSFWPGAIT